MVETTNINSSTPYTESVPLPSEQTTTNSSTGAGESSDISVSRETGNGGTTSGNTADKPTLQTRPGDAISSLAFSDPFTFLLAVGIEHQEKSIENIDNQLKHHGVEIEVQGAKRLEALKEQIEAQSKRQKGGLFGKIISVVAAVAAVALAVGTLGAAAPVAALAIAGAALTIISTIDELTDGAITGGNETAQWILFGLTVATSLGAAGPALLKAGSKVAAQGAKLASQGAKLASQSAKLATQSAKLATQSTKLATQSANVLRNGGGLTAKLLTNLGKSANTAKTGQAAAAAGKAANGATKASVAAGKAADAGADAAKAAQDLTRLQQFHQSWGKSITAGAEFVDGAALAGGSAVDAANAKFEYDIEKAANRQDVATAIIDDTQGGIDFLLDTLQERFATIEFIWSGTTSLLEQQDRIISRSIA